MLVAGYHFNAELLRRWNLDDDEGPEKGCSGDLAHKKE
jgi:hypothetical protein